MGLVGGMLRDRSTQSFLVDAQEHCSDEIPLLEQACCSARTVGKVADRLAMVFAIEEKGEDAVRR